MGTPAWGWPSGFPVGGPAPPVTQQRRRGAGGSAGRLRPERGRAGPSAAHGPARGPLRPPGARGEPGPEPAAPPRAEQSGPGPGGKALREAGAGGEEEEEEEREEARRGAAGKQDGEEPGAEPGTRRRRHPRSQRRTRHPSLGTPFPLEAGHSQPLLLLLAPPLAVSPQGHQPSRAAPHGARRSRRESAAALRW